MTIADQPNLARDRAWRDYLLAGDIFRARIRRGCDEAHCANARRIMDNAGVRQTVAMRPTIEKEIAAQKAASSPETNEQRAALMKLAANILKWASGLDQFIETGKIPGPVAFSSHSAPDGYRSHIDRKTVAYSPAGDPKWYRLTWADVRKELQKASQPQQLEMAI